MISVLLVKRLIKVLIFKWTGNHYGKIGDVMVLLTRASSVVSEVLELYCAYKDVCVSGFFCWCCQTQIVV